MQFRDNEDSFPLLVKMGQKMSNGIWLGKWKKKKNENENESTTLGKRQKWLNLAPWKGFIFTFWGYSYWSSILKVYINKVYAQNQNTSATHQNVYFLYILFLRHNQLLTLLKLLETHHNPLQFIYFFFIYRKISNRTPLII